ncbi:MAG: ATP-binding protein [Gammaproteobacteria bacterium]|nr:ATP-binding protein [Gammaproteobacteria bacterium]
MHLSVFLQSGATPDLVQDEETLAYRPLLGRWLIDLALMLDWHRPSQHRRHHIDSVWENRDFLSLTGLADRVEDDTEEFENRAARQQRRQALELQFVEALTQRRAALAQQVLDPALPLLRNLTWLGEFLNLSLVEQTILAFAVLLESDPLFQRAIAQQHQETPTSLLFTLLAALTGTSVKAVQQALDTQSILMVTELIDIRIDSADLEDKLKPHHDLSAILMPPYPDAEALVACFLQRAPHRSLTLGNFSHLQRDTETTVGWLRAALDQKLPGANLLLYGPPGVGKTEYAAVLADAVQADLYEVNYADKDGDPIRGTARLGAFNLCQRLLTRRDRALLLFDEVEDVFERDPLADLFGGGRGRAAGGKAWINRTLEHNPVPALWITNDVRSMDPAFLRRFDYAIRFSTPPQAVRLTIAAHHLGDWAGDDDWLEGIAAQEHLTPGQLERAAKLARHAGSGDPARQRALVRQALDRSAGLLGQRRTPARPVAPTGYDLRYLNTDLPIPKLVAALQRRPQGLLCFYGPPGTGKSALAQHIAEQLEKPLLLKRASDLLDPYVGGTEQHLAAMFEEARQREAVLVLDEADSFLRDRRHARQSWEISQVNELLTQMETFDGLFIATTNFMASLDVASLRRFPWKVRFDVLKPAQRWALFAQEFVRLGGALAEAEDFKAEVWRLERLTPGDIAAVVRQYALWDETPPAGVFYNRLCAEVAAKAIAEGEDHAVSTAPTVTAPRRRLSVYS